MLPAISVNIGCCSHHVITLQLPQMWPLRELRIETGCPPSSHQPLQPPPTVHPEETQDGKTQDSGPRELRCISKEWFQWAHLPIHRKALNSLTWDVSFSLINSNLLKFPIPGLCCNNSYIILAPPWPLWSRPSELTERLHSRLKSSFCLPNKT